MQLNEPTAIWTKLPWKIRNINHAAVMEPISRQLWVMGGLDEDRRTTSDIFQIGVIEVPTLEEIVIHHTVRKICANDPRLSEEKFPRHIGHEIEAHRSEISGHHHCKEDKKCIACLQAIDNNDNLNFN